MPLPEKPNLSTARLKARLTALWIFLFKFIAPFVDRMTMREVRLSKISTRRRAYPGR